jgi:molecular chaperone GrpE
VNEEMGNQKFEEVEQEVKKESKKEKKDKHSKQVEELTNEVNNWKNKFYTAYADLENLRKSIEKDHREALRYRAEGFIEKLLQPLDGFHMALKMEPKSSEMAAFLQGFSYIYQNIISALESEGLKEMNPTVDQKFDESWMYAVDTVECPDKDENLVVNVYARGYKLHDRIIRPAMVYVSTKHKKVEENETNNEKADA